MEIKIIKSVKKEAEKAFMLRDLGFGGGTTTGWNRAKQLSTKELLSIKDLQTMYAWFARHMYASKPSYELWKKNGKPKTKEWHNKNGIISWLIWGGDAGFRWINSDKILKILSNYFDKEYIKKTL